MYNESRDIVQFSLCVFSPFLEICEIIYIITSRYSLSRNVMNKSSKDMINCCTVFSIYLDQITCSYI